MAKNEMDAGVKLAGVAIISAVVAVVFYMFMCVSVGAGKRGVLTQMGAVQDEVLGEGFHVISPLKSVHKMDIQVQSGKVESEASSKDLQVVHTTVTLNYHPDPSRVNWIYQNIPDYESRAIAPAIQEHMKRATAMYTAEELVTKREIVKDNFQKSLTTALAQYHIAVDGVFITNFQFSKSFNEAIEAKVTAEQEALQEKNNLEKVKFQNQQKLDTARTQAESIRIQAQAITQQGGKEYVNLKAVEKWDGKLPEQMIPGAALPFVNLQRRGE